MAQAQSIIQQPQILPSSFPLPDKEAEIERLRSGAPFITTDRDVALEQWLDTQRKSGNSGFICSAKGSGLSDSCQNYRMKRVKSKGVIQQLPVPIVYLRVPPICSVSHFHTTLLEALHHPITTGRLKDKRPRVRGRLKSFQTQQLVVDDAEFLSFEAFCELSQIYDVLKIPSVLCGTYSLEKMLKQGYWDRVGNSFLDYYEYPPMTQDEVLAVITAWEKSFLQWPEESDFSLEDVLKAIYSKTRGLRDALNEVLRKAAVQTLEQGSTKISAHTIEAVLTARVQPRIKPAMEG